MRGRYCNTKELNALGKSSSLAKAQEQSREQSSGADWTGHSENLELVDERWTAGLSRGTATPSCAVRLAPFPCVIETAPPTTLKSLISSTCPLSVVQYPRLPASVTFLETTVSHPLSQAAQAVGAFVPSQREVDGTAAASPLVDDLNDSSGSYHTAPGSSEGEEGFEDSSERIHSPLLQSESSERRQPESKGLSSGHPEVSKDSSPNLEAISKSPVPQLCTASPSEVLNAGERTPSPGHNSPYTLSPEPSTSSLSCSSVEKRCSPSPTNPKVHLEAEPRRITPTFKDRHNRRLTSVFNSKSLP
ncbi:hypothetical protein E3U43_001666 [Larimichthys crocea]|uniref:Uncharacterized protein n=1 Tax=Larimichthys crocea TaxID=215358 RepID=A0ACD3RE50_LARCR|nr:hypothetical protein E3U43_001666 [Larimichthys crocea]